MTDCLSCDPLHIRQSVCVCVAVVVVIVGYDFDGSRVAGGMELISQMAALCEERKSACACFKGACSV